MKFGARRDSIVSVRFIMSLLFFDVNYAVWLTPVRCVMIFLFQTVFSCAFILEHRY